MLWILGVFFFSDLIEELERQRFRNSCRFIVSLEVLRYYLYSVRSIRKEKKRWWAHYRCICNQCNCSRNTNWVSLLFSHSFHLSLSNSMCFYLVLDSSISVRRFINGLYLMATLFKVLIFVESKKQWSPSLIFDDTEKLTRILFITLDLASSRLTLAKRRRLPLFCTRL